MFFCFNFFFMYNTYNTVSDVFLFSYMCCYTVHKTVVCVSSWEYLCAVNICARCTVFIWYCAVCRISMATETRVRGASWKIVKSLNAHRRRQRRSAHDRSIFSSVKKIIVTYLVRFLILITGMLTSRHGPNLWKTFIKCIDRIWYPLLIPIYYITLQYIYLIKKCYFIFKSDGYNFFTIYI